MSDRIVTYRVETMEEKTKNVYKKQFTLPIELDSSMYINNLVHVVGNACKLAEEIGYEPAVILDVLESIHDNIEENMSRDENEEGEEHFSHSILKRPLQKGGGTAVSEEKEFDNFLAQFNASKDFQRVVFKTFIKSLEGESN